MPVVDNLFKQRLAAGERQVGLWLTMASATAAEICAGCGFDWLLIDMEHSPNDMAELVDQLRAIGDRTPALVRVPWNDPVVVKRVLDAGALTVMFPFVQTPEEAQAAVRSTRYPPSGIRGVAGTGRVTDYGRIPQALARAAERVSVVVQIETPEALAQAGAIAAVDGVDAVFIGPNDLAANMGLLGQAGAPEVQALLGQALSAIKAAGKAAGALEFRPDAAEQLFDQGFDFLAVGGEASILVQHGAALAARFKTA